MADPFYTVEFPNKDHDWDRRVVTTESWETACLVYDALANSGWKPQIKNGSETLKEAPTGEAPVRLAIT